LSFSEEISRKMASTTKASDREQQGQLKDDQNRWKFRAPYTVQNADSFHSRYEGGCHCGKVQFHVKQTKPLEAKYCHCTTCQSLHGAPFGWTAVFEKEDVKFTNGHHDLTWYDSMEKTTRHKLPCKVTCSYCHASVMDEGKNKILLYPATIKFKSEDERKNFAAQYHMFYKERVMNIMDGLPKWEGMKDCSKLMTE